MQIKIPVTWELCGFVYVEADNIEEAMDKFDKTCDYVPLPDGEYVDGSFQITCRDIEFVEMFNPESMRRELKNANRDDSDQ